MKAGTTTIITLVTLTSLLLSCQARVEEEPDFLELDEIDGFSIDSHLIDSIDEEIFSREEEQQLQELHQQEQQEEATEKAAIERHVHIFEKKCPVGYFKCANGECISPKWHCDGHYDCDDFSDELNCTAIEVPISSEMMKFDPPPPVTTVVKTTTPMPPSPPTSGHPEEISEIKFNSSYEPLMLFSTGGSIRGYWMRSRIYFDVFSVAGRRPQVPTKQAQPSSITQAVSVLFDFLNTNRGSSPSASSPAKKAGEGSYKTSSTIVGVDMDPTNKDVYWVELGRDAGVYSTTIDSDQFETRHRRQFGPQRKTLVDSGLISPEDIALDTLGRNLYITDAGLPAIVVCSIKNNHCKMIVKDKIHKPRAIIADSSTGWLTYTDWGDHPGIFLVSMDGKKRETLIDTDVVWPNGLAADHSTNQLYWADARLSKIERIDLATKKRHEVIKEAASNPFSLAMFENRIYWSDWAANDIRTCDKISGNDTKAIMRTDSLYGIHIYHPSQHLSGAIENPCWSKYCSHMCLLAPPKNFAQRKSGSLNAVCDCPNSMALSIGDRATCYEVHLSFLLVNVNNYVSQVFPEEIGLHTVREVIQSRNHRIRDMAADWVNYRLFCFDSVKQYIYTVGLKAHNTKIEPFMRTNQTIKALLYDSLAENLYWLNQDRGTLSISSIYTKTEVVLRKDLGHPVCMVFDVKYQFLYIARPYIVRTNALGQAKSDLVIVGSSDIGTPVALHLDDQRLYWADSKYETIESIELDPKSSTGVKPNSRLHYRGQLGPIYAFAVHEEHLMWMVKNEDYLYKAKLDDRTKVSLRLPSNGGQTSEMARIVVVEPGSHSISHPCDIGCQYGCVLGANRSATCVFPSATQGSTTSTTTSTTTTSTHMPDTAVHDVTHNTGLDFITGHIHSDTAVAHIPIDHPATPDTTPGAIPDDATAIALTVPEEGESSLVWLIVLLLLLSITGLVTLGSLLVLYKQGRLPRQVSLSVSFLSQPDKDGAVLLLDD